MLIPRKPGTAYYDTHLWVPQTYDPEVISRLKRIYRYYLPQPGPDGRPQFLRLWREAPHHLLMPRTVVIQDIEPINLIPDFPVIQPRSRITLDWKGGVLQRESFEAWMSAGNGVLNLACGKGKTTIALEAVAQMRTPALVVVHTSVLYKQWLKRIAQFLDNVSVGVIQGAPSKWTWDRDIVVAMLKTLWKHAPSLTPVIRSKYGVIVFDEIHRMPSEKLGLWQTCFPVNVSD